MFGNFSIEVRVAFILGFGLGFFFSVWILDGMYRKAFRQYTNEVVRQYRAALKGEKR